MAECTENIPYIPSEVPLGGFMVGHPYFLQVLLGSQHCLKVRCPRDGLPICTNRSPGEGLILAGTFHPLCSPSVALR